VFWASPQELVARVAARLAAAGAVSAPERTLGSYGLGNALLAAEQAAG